MTTDVKLPPMTLALESDPRIKGDMVRHIRDYARAAVELNVAELRAEVAQLQGALDANWVSHQTVVQSRQRAEKAEAALNAVQGEPVAWRFRSSPKAQWCYTNQEPTEWDIREALFAAPQPPAVAAVPADVERDAARLGWLCDAPSHSRRWPRWNVQRWSGEVWVPLQGSDLRCAIDADAAADGMPIESQQPPAPSIPITERASRVAHGGHIESDQTAYADSQPRGGDRGDTAESERAQAGCADRDAYGVLNRQNDSASLAPSIPPVDHLSRAEDGGITCTQTTDDSIPPDVLALLKDLLLVLDDELANTIHPSAVKHSMARIDAILAKHGGA